MDQSQKALYMARQTVKAVNDLMAALSMLDGLEAERAGAGLDLTAFNDVYAASADTQHIDGAALNSVLNVSTPAVWNFMTTNNHDDNYQKVRLATEWR